MARKPKELHPLLQLQRDWLIVMASKLLKMSVMDISKVFGLSRETVYKILNSESTSKLDTKELINGK